MLLKADRVGLAAWAGVLTVGLAYLLLPLTMLFGGQLVEMSVWSFLRYAYPNLLMWYLGLTGWFIFPLGAVVAMRLWWRYVRPGLSMS